MLRTNLSTRPFYNVRAVQVALGACSRRSSSLITLFNVVQIVRLATSQQTLGASAAEAERRRRGCERGGEDPRADQPRGTGGRRQRGARGERIIDQRAFSWTELLRAVRGHAARRTSASPPCSRAGREADSSSAVGVEARRAEDLDAFVEALEMTGAFHNVLPTDEQTTIRRAARGDRSRASMCRRRAGR